MKLSVAMCTYNGARYLQEQLASLAAQTRLPDELVVCDDCSSDGTVVILEEFKAQAPFPVRLYLNEQNLRVLRNFAKAISLCEGDVIALCDQDDVWLPEKLSRFEAEFARAPEVGLVFSDLEVVGEELQPLGFTSWQSGWVQFGQEEQQLFKQGKALAVLLTRNVITGAGAAFRREFVDLVLPFPEVSKTFLHDYWLGLMIATVARLSPIPEPLVKYRVHADQQASLLLPREHSSVRQEAKGKRAHYPFEWETLRRVAERLAEQQPAYREVLSDLQQHLEHGRVRVSLPEYRFHQRLRRAVGELAAGRYHRYQRPNAHPCHDFFNDVMPYSVVEFMESVGIGPDKSTHPPLATTRARRASPPIKEE
ncbi:MAG: glycosyltransferase family 2 protein [Pyrinomonadaceae bacterium]